MRRSVPLVTSLHVQVDGLGMTRSCGRGQSLVPCDSLIIESKHVQRSTMLSLVLEVNTIEP